MIAIRKILAPTDFSPHAETAVRYACGLAERLGSELHLLHVLSEVVPAGPDPMFGSSAESVGGKNVLRPTFPRLFRMIRRCRKPPFVVAGIEAGK